MRCREHQPRCTGRRITAYYPGKDNVQLTPESLVTVSTGELAICEKCGVKLILHDKRLGCRFEVLEDVA